MRLVETFQLPQSILDKTGNYFKGDICIHELDAREYIQANTEASMFMIKEYETLNSNLPEDKKMEWDGVIPSDVMTKFLVIKSVTINGTPLDPKGHVPTKLWMILAAKSLPYNDLTPTEFKTVFLSSSTSNKPTCATS